MKINKCVMNPLACLKCGDQYLKKNTIICFVEHKKAILGRWYMCENKERL